MAGTLNVTTISGASTITGVSTLNAASGVLATQNGMTGIAKAWVNFNGIGTVTIRSSFNVSSITDNGTGDYTVNFTTAMSNANYCPVAMVGAINPTSTIRGVCISATTAPTTSALRVSNTNVSGTAEDLDYYCIAILSS